MTFKDGSVANGLWNAFTSPEKPRQHNSYSNETIISECTIHKHPQLYVLEYKAYIKRTPISRVAKWIYQKTKNKTNKTKRPSNITAQVDLHSVT